MLRTLTIGLPVHEEESTLREFFASLIEAIDQLPETITIETIACINGSQDNSAEVLKALSIEHAEHRMKLSVIASEKGKLKAQTEIVKTRETDGPICFMDSDILISPNTLQALLSTLQDNSGLFIAYAHVEPVYPGANNRTVFEDILYTHYAYRHLHPPRKYFHGRAFVMRDATELENLWDDIPERVAALDDQALTAKLTLLDGPFVDDIFLSRVIAHKYGLDAIREVPEAHAYFHPPASLNDFFEALRRTRLEIVRLNALYPEHAYLQEQYFGRVRNAQALELMPEGEARKYRHLCEIEDLLSAVIDAGFDLGTMPEIPNRWINVPSTKKSFGEIQPELRL